MNNLKSKIDILFSKKYLLYTNLTLGGTFLGLGDLLEQILNKKVFNAANNDKVDNKDKNNNLKVTSTQIDTNRIESMIKTGVGMGACGHYWYQYLDKKFPGTSRSAIIKKLLCEMAIGPPWLLLTFITVGYFENQTLKQSVDKFKNSLIFLIIADWCFYVPLQSLNFKFIPPRFRYAYVVCLTVVYDIFLAFILHK